MAGDRAGEPAGEATAGRTDTAAAAAAGGSGVGGTGAAGGGAARTRGDACPGALRLHAAADGHLARVRLPGGALTAAAAAALAAAARELGDGALALTTRGNVELRGLAEGCGAGLAERLDAVGLLPSDTHERVRNIAVSPLTGLDGGGLADLRPAAAELDALLCGTPEAARLSGRFLFALDDGRGDMAELDPDVKLIAQVGGRAALVLAAVDTGVRVAVRDAARCALAAALEFLAARRDYDWSCWRIAELGSAAGVLTERLPAALDRAGIPHRVDRTAARRPAEEGRTGHGPAVPPGLVRQRDGAVTLVAGARFGRFAAEQFAALARAAGESGAGVLFTTPWRTVAVPGLCGDAARRAAEEAERSGLLVDPASPWVGVTACTGLPGCGKSLADVRGVARGVGLGVARGGAAVDGCGAGPAATSDGRPSSPASHPAGGPGDSAGDGAEGPGRDLLPVHYSGCERRCGHPRGAWVDVTAVAGEGDVRYGLTVRRRSRFAAGWADQPEAAPPVDLAETDLPAAVEEARRGTP